MPERERTIEQILENFRYWTEKRRIADVWNALFQCPDMKTCPKCLTYECNDGTKQCNRLMNGIGLDECPRRRK